VAANKYPVRRFVLPRGLADQQNGKLRADLLVSIRPNGHLYASAAASYHAMKRAAKLDGIVLKPTSTFDAYRPYSVQKAVFLQRYTKTPQPGRPTRTWNAETWYLKPGMGASLAAPGTSNHGWGCAVDIWNVTKNGRLEWLLANADSFGWSWEIQSEPWHIRYILGDRLPARMMP